LLNEWGATQCQNLVGQTRGDFSGSTKPSWIGGQRAGLNFPGGANTVGYLSYGAETWATDLGRSTSNPATYAFRIYRADSTDGVVIGRNDGNTISPGWQISVFATSMLFTHEQSTSNRQTSCAGLVNSSWQTVVIVDDGSLVSANVQIYLDGIKVAHSVDQDGIGTSGSDAAETLYVGRGNANYGLGNNGFFGTIDWVYLWKRMLTPGEVRSLTRDPYQLFRDSAALFTGRFVEPAATLAVLNDLQRAAPAAGANVTLTPSGTAWTSSAWVELIAAVGADSILTGLVVSTAWGNSSVVDNHWEIDVATGAAASEVVIATFKGRIRGIFSDVQDSTQWIPTVLGIDAIANGARLSARIRTGSTDTTVWTCAATYIHKPLSGTILTTAQPLIALPAAAAAVSVTASGTPWANGAWVELRAASGAALVLTGIVLSADTSGECEFDLGTGGSGSETVITTVRIVAEGASTYFGTYPLSVPLDNIAASTRIAARLRHATASAGGMVALMGFEKPL